jgi:hypothetical protein
VSTTTFLGGFPQVAIALVGAFSCALGIAFLVLKVILGLMTVTNANAASR